MAEARQAQFVPAPAGAALGHHAGPVWFRATLANPGPAARRLLVEAGYANLDELDLYVLRNGAVSAQWQTGTARPPAARALPAPLFLFPVQLAPGETVTLYLRVVARTVINLPLAVYDEQAYVEQASAARGWLGLFFGVIAATLVFAGFIWRITRDRTFLDFGIAILLAAGYFAGFDGLLAAAWPALAPGQQTVMFFCGCLSVTFTLRFAAGFLDSGSRSPRLARAMRMLAVIALVAAVLMAVLPLLWSMAIAMLFSVAMAVLMLAAGIVALRGGFAPARLFVLAISVHLASIVLLSVGALVDIPGLFASANQVHRIGFVFNLVCFTFALGQRLRLLDEERRRIGEHMLQVSAEQRARNEFQARMSHELRTPMTGVLGMAELLDHTELDTRQRRYLATLRYSGEILLNLINDMLDHARIESGRLQIQRAAFDLLRLVDECRQLFEQQPRDNGVSLRIDIGPGVSRVVVGDAVRLRQILVNVLLQAFRGTGRGHVDLRIRLAEPGGWLHFDVLHPAPPATATATGPDAALATSVRLVELMGGRLTVQPAPGAGTLCRIEVPLFAAA